MKPNQQPACASHDILDPDAWFPDPAQRKSKLFQTQQENTIRLSVEALKACNSCPIRQACLEFSFQIVDTVNYGIYGGTLPNERRAAMGEGALRGDRTSFEQVIRRNATKAGVPIPKIGKRKKVTSKWLDEQPELLAHNINRGIKGEVSYTSHHDKPSR